MDKTLRDSIAKIIELPDEDLALLMTCVVSRKLKKGEILLNAGEVCRGFYLVEQGYLRTYYNKEDGVAINLNFTFEGSFTTNLKSYKNQRPSAFIIEAGEDTSIWIFNIKLLSPKEVTGHPLLGKLVHRLAISLLLASEEHSNLIKIYTPAERYHHIEKNKPQLLQRVPLSQMASYLGVARETLSRIRAKKQAHNGL